MDCDASLRTEQRSDLSKAQHGLNICDIADEEVHFTRSDMLGSPIMCNQPQQSQPTPFNSYLFNEKPASARSEPLGRDFTDVYLNNNGNLNRGSISSPPSYEPLSSERAKSSKLLHCIGSKLRRGSNYLAAPKLVGEYLLGITIQSWSEFLDTSRMMRTPSNRQQLTRRLLNNLTYFQGNYLCVSLVLVVYCILTSPLLLLAIISYLLTLYFVTLRSATGRHLRIANYRPNLQQQYSFITLLSLPLLWVAGAPSAVFWVIGASFVVVGLHASLYSQEQSTHEVLADGGDLNHNHNWNSLANQANFVGESGPAVRYYYNHYPNGCRQYLPLGSPPISNKEAESSSSLGGYSIAHWMTFGSSGSKHYQNKESVKKKQQRQQEQLQQQPNRTPEVTIISQDYAGLGRVYEV